MIKIGLLGLGNVGQGVLELLKQNQSLIEKRLNQSLSIEKILVRNPEKYKHLNLPEELLTTEANDILKDKEISIIVEVLGGEYPAYDYICQALKNKKHVVTANKEVVSKHKSTFFRVAKENNVDLYFEGAVCGGIPIIRALKTGFSANKIQTLYGILNGTTNYILTQIEKTQREFKPILKEAQKKGFAEADPTMDIEGIDAAHKLIILAAVAFKVDLQVEDIHCEGISNIELKDIQYAQQLGYKIKLLGIGSQLNNQEVRVCVHPTLVPNSHLLAQINNELNAVYIEGNAAGEALLTGKGAGSLPTASSVVADIIDLCFETPHIPSPRNLETNLEKAHVQSLEKTESAFYLRITVKNQPGVLEKICGTLGKHTINIANILQHGKGKNAAEVVLMTHEVSESKFFETLEECKALKEVQEINAVIRCLK